MQSSHPSTHTLFPASRAAGLERLEAFAPKAGRAYARGRNVDVGEWDRQAVSGLSPYLSRRLITEEEVIGKVLEHHTLSAAEKYIQEVSWRTYWKGWLEQRPGVWDAYVKGREEKALLWSEDEDRARRLSAAVSGRTHITAFNHWVEQLTTEGYLHNHARMWFAGIWVYDLGLPWELGAAFFYRHLLDRDAASNTLSWRWVAGLQTRGKRYLPSADNIARNTEGRFDEADTLTVAYQGPAFVEPPDRRMLSFPEDDFPGPRVLLLCMDDLAMDLPEAWTERVDQVILVDGSMPEEHQNASLLVQNFNREALHDARMRWQDVAPVRMVSIQDLPDLWPDLMDQDVAMPWVTVGPLRSQLDAIWAAAESRPRVLVRDWDRERWPMATSGFFGFWKKYQKLF